MPTRKKALIECQLGTLSWPAFQISHSPTGDML